MKETIIYLLAVTATEIITVLVHPIGGLVCHAGLNETTAKQEGFDIVVGESVTVNWHPEGILGAVPTKVKLIFSKDNGLLIGGGISGGSSVGELINVIIACIQKAMTAYEVSLFQMGTHPALTASPIAYQLVNAAELAVAKL